MKDSKVVIAIDGNEANVSKRVGISEYAFELIDRFQKSTDPNIIFHIYLKDIPLPHMPAATESFKYIFVKPKKMWTQFGLPLHLYTHFPRPNIFFSPNHYSPRFSPVPTVIAMQDVGYILYPEQYNKSDLYQLVHWTNYSVKKAAHIIAVSENTKKDTMKYYNVTPSRITVILEGIKFHTTPTDKDRIAQLQKKYNFTQPYLMFLGTLQPRKNIIGVIESFALLAKKFPKLQLVVVGKKGWLYEPILHRSQELGISDRVHFLGFIPDEESRILYANAACFVFPCLYEGFGLPALEAMQEGTPVVTSPTASLPEVCGDAALYADPYDYHDIATKVEQILTDKKTRDNLIKKGYQQIKKFDWDISAEKTLELLVKLAREHA